MLDESPSPLYGPGARALQDQFDSRRLADQLVKVTLHEPLSDNDIRLIGEQSTVWLSTVDTQGWPDVSYKGGARGFVRMIGRDQLQIPSYDGNGMFRTLGNIVDTGRVALLFIDTTRPWRLRIHATASVSTDPALLAEHVGAQAVLIAHVVRAFPNCGRYIHQDGVISPYVPDGITPPPVPSWKTSERFRDVLPSHDPAVRP